LFCSPFSFSLLTGFGEENIKRQLQAVAEGVAASVLQSPFPEKPAVLSGDHIDSHGAVVDAKVQDEGNNQSDKTSQGVQVLDDNLQVFVKLILNILCTPSIVASNTCSPFSAL
jgi:hypothetical protein